MKKAVSFLLVIALCLGILAVGASAAGTQFSDVAPGVWYVEEVEWASENGYVAGTSATTFSPNAICTRAQAVTILWSLFGKPEPTTSANPFSDVKISDWYYKSVLWAVEKGITSGTSSTTFSPNSECTRAQIVTFFWASIGKPVPNGRNPFTDVKTADWFSKSVLWAAENSVTSGTTPTTFSPNAKCTRAQIVQFLYSFHHKAIPALTASNRNIGPIEVFVGENISLEVIPAGGIAPYRYQWYGYNDAPIAGATAPTLNKQMQASDFTAPNGDGSRTYFYCKVTDSYGQSAQAEKIYVTKKEAPITGPAIVVGTANAAAGAEGVLVKVDLKNSPALLTMALNIEYDESAMILTEVNSGNAMTNFMFTAPRNLKSGCTAAWFSVGDAYTPADGEILILKFDILDTAAIKDHAIKVSYSSGDIFGDGYSEPDFELFDGKITVS